LSTKKRFEQIESRNGDEPKKPTLLERVSFKRKLEIEGVARENIPQEKVVQKALAPKTEIRKIQVNQPQVGKPATFAREVELAEQMNRTRQIPQSNNAQLLQKNIQYDQKTKLDEAQQKAEAAKSKILMALIIIPILAYIVYKVSGTVGTGSMRGRGGSIIMLVISVVLGGLGSRRRNRW
jgi:hypothetical protein